MTSRTAWQACVAFFAAVLIGRFAFHAPAKPQPLTDEAPNVGPSTHQLASTQAQTPPVIAPRNDVFNPTIDRSLKEVAGGVENKNVRMSHFFSTQYGEGTLATGDRQKTIRWFPKTQEVLRGEDTVAVISSAKPAVGKMETLGGNQRFVYEDTYAMTDDRMYVRPEGGVEHDFILHQLPGQIDHGMSLAYTGYLQISDGLTLWDGETQITGAYRTRNSILFKNPLGNGVFILRQPYAYDNSVSNSDGTLNKEKQASQEHQKSLTGCEYLIDFDDSGIKLAVLTRSDWLLAPGREFPVVIDPNLGPFGLADGNPPLYVGAVSSDVLIPAYAGGQKINIEETANYINKPDNGYGHIVLPFDFTYYGLDHPAGDVIFPHIDGWLQFTDPLGFGPHAGWCPDPPAGPGYCPSRDPTFDAGPVTAGQFGGVIGQNLPIPTNGQYPYNCIFAYWDDLKFSGDQDTGIYWFTDGVAPDRRLIVEWHKMAYVGTGNAQDTISFNVVLFECDSKIEIIIKGATDVDRGLATIGIENIAGTAGIQYSFNDSLIGQPELSPNTALAFQVSLLSTITVQNTGLSGCRPWRVCFESTVTIPPPTCGSGPSIPPSFAFHWTFGPRASDQLGDQSEAFTQNVCHTWVEPGVYNVNLVITDEFGAVSTYLNNLQVNVCDVPLILTSVTPQGGTAPLTVDLLAKTSSRVGVQSIQIQSGQSGFVIERLGDQNEPGVFTPLATAPGTLGTDTIFQGTDRNGQPIQTGIQYTLQHTQLFATPGTYRVRVTFGGVDNATGLQTNAEQTIFVYVTAPNSQINNSMLITESSFTIDWQGKYDGIDPDGLPPNTGGARPGDGLADKPDNDRISVKGIINLPGMTLSSLFGKRVFIALNGFEPIFDGILDASGHAVQGNKATGVTGEFQISLPTGNFTCWAKGNFYSTLGIVTTPPTLPNLGDKAERKLLPAHFRVQIDTIFSSEGTAITYDYIAGAGSKPVAPGNQVSVAKGTYNIGSVVKYGNLPGGATGSGGGQTVLLSGGFMITDAKLKVIGSSVIADIKGVLARSGGDDLRPQSNSDVVVSIGGFTESLNFSTSPTFKASGKAPAQKFSFKRGSSLGRTGISSLTWINKAGAFQIRTYPIPISQVGINPLAATQTLKVGLAITPENHVVFDAVSTFELFKTSETDFSRKIK